MLASCPVPETHHLAVHVSPFLLISSLHVLTPIVLVCAGDASTACHLKASPTRLARLFSRISHPSLGLDSSLSSSLLSSPSRPQLTLSAHRLSSTSLKSQFVIFPVSSSSRQVFFSSNYGGVYSVAAAGLLQRHEEVSLTVCV